MASTSSTGARRREGGQAACDDVRDRRDRSGRQQDRSGRKQDRSGRKQIRKQQSGSVHRQIAKRKREEAAAGLVACRAAEDVEAAAWAAGMDAMAVDLMAASSTALSSIVEVESTAVGSITMGLMAAGSTASSMAAGSTTAASTTALTLTEFVTAQPTAATSSSIASTALPYTAIASTAIVSTAANPNPDPDPDPDDDPNAEWGSDSGSSGLGDDQMCEYPMDSEEAEMREAEVRVEHRAACEQRRVRAEIEAAERAAADAQACEQNRVHTEVMAAQQAAAYAQASCLALPTNDRDEVDGWMRDYEIDKLRTSVHNEQHLLSLNLIDPSCLSRTKYRLERALELQSSQEGLVHERLGHALATAAISHAIQEFYYS